MSLGARLGGCDHGTTAPRLLVLRSNSSAFHLISAYNGRCCEKLVVVAFFPFSHYSGLLMFCEQVVHVQYLCIMRFKLPCIGGTRCIMVAPQV